MQSLNSSNNQPVTYIVNDMPGIKFSDGKKYIIVQEKDKIAEEEEIKNLEKDTIKYFENLMKIDKLKKQLNK